jgi:hypothetical protein
VDEGESEAMEDVRAVPLRLSREDDRRHTHSIDGGDDAVACCQCGADVEKAAECAARRHTVSYAQFTTSSTLTSTPVKPRQGGGGTVRTF